MYGSSPQTSSSLTANGISSSLIKELNQSLHAGNREEAKGKNLAQMDKGPIGRALSFYGS
jgi:hypothetical protein